MWKKVLLLVGLVALIMATRELRTEKLTVEHTAGNNGPESVSTSPSWRMNETDQSQIWRVQGGAGNFLIVDETASDNIVALLGTNGNLALDGGLRPSNGADALDVYDEAAFAPTYSCNTNCDSVSHQNASCTKIGNSVQCWFDVDVDPTSTGTPTIVEFADSDLPFSSTLDDAVTGSCVRRAASSNSGPSLIFSNDVFFRIDDTTSTSNSGWACHLTYRSD